MTGTDPLMTPERWQRLRELFASAAELDADARRKLIEEACASDEAMRVEAERLLAARDADTGFFDRPPLAAVEMLCDPDLVGTRIKDRYVVGERIAQSQFSTVWRARDETLDGRPVVVKILDRQAASSEWIERHFRTEIAAMARINDPGVAGVLDAGETPDGRPFLVIQFVPGVTLREALRDGPLPLARVARILLDLGRALEAAHRLRIVHRDLKPENIMLRDPGTAEERAVIIDFGIATVRDAGGPPDMRTQVPVGTPKYMAPEQNRGEASPATDIYTLGLIAAELIGERRTPALRLIDQALSVKPAERPTSARLFTEQLAGALAGETRTRRAILYPVLGALALGAAYLAFWPAAAPAPVSEITYFLIAGNSGRGFAAGAPFLPGPGVWFRAGDRVRLVFEGALDGNLYLVGETVPADGSPRRYTVLLPQGRLPTRTGHAVEVPESGEHWIEFDQRRGREKIWLVWSSALVPELEPLARFANERDRGAVGDPAVCSSVRELLARRSLTGTETRVNEQDRRVTVRTRAGILVHPIDLGRQ